jgi:hypothetical protein
MGVMRRIKLDDGGGMSEPKVAVIAIHGVGDHKAGRRPRRSPRSCSIFIRDNSRHSNARRCASPSTPPWQPDAAPGQAEFCTGALAHTHYFDEHSPDVAAAVRATIVNAIAWCAGVAPLSPSRDRSATARAARP